MNVCIYVCSVYVICMYVSMRLGVDVSMCMYVYACMSIRI